MANRVSGKRRRIVLQALCAAAMLGAALTPARADDTAVPAPPDVAKFYRGKTVTIVIGSTPSGGYDLYGRLVAQFISKYLPGHPSIVVSNMPAAASIADAQYIYNSAPKDGTFIGALKTGALMEPLLGANGPTHYDSTKFSYVGSANADAFLCVARTDAPVKTLEDVMRTPMIIGASNAGGSTRDFPTLLNNVLHTKFKIVTGYPGTTEISLAVEKGEVQGACGLAWSSVTSGWSQWITQKKVTLLAQEVTKANPEMEKLGVPLAINYAKTDEQRAIMRLIYAQGDFGRPYVMAPEVRAERLQAVRDAFKAALSDPETKAQARKERLDLYPMWGEELQKTIDDLFALPPDIIAKAKVATTDAK